jgi:hypothetical protein
MSTLVSVTDRNGLRDLVRRQETKKYGSSWHQQRELVLLLAATFGGVFVSWCHLERRSAAQNTGLQYYFNTPYTVQVFWYDI